VAHGHDLVLGVDLPEPTDPQAAVGLADLVVLREVAVDQEVAVHPAAVAVLAAVVDLVAVDAVACKINRN